MAEKSQFVIRTPEDVLAWAPLSLGFIPEECLVLIGCDGRQMAARVDRPADAEQAAAVASQTLASMERNKVGSLLLVSYVESAELAQLAGTAVVEEAERRGMRVLDHLWMCGEVWRRDTGGGVFDPPEGRRFDLTEHPMMAQAALEGRPLPLAGRASLRERLRGVAVDNAEQVAQARERLEQLDTAGLAAEGRWVQQRARQFVADGEQLPAEEEALFLAAMERAGLRDAVMAVVSQENAAAMVDLLTGLVRRAPEPTVAPVAALLGFAAWQRGDGAMAWCAVDRAREVDPQNRLASLVAGVLTAAIPPDAWSEFREDVPEVFEQPA